MSDAAAVTAHRVTLGRAVRSEAIKLVGLRSTAWLIGVALVSPFVVTLLWVSAGSESADAAAILGLATPSTFATLLFLIIIAIMTATSDYENSAAIQAYSVVPSRTPVALAKYVIVLVLALVVSLITSFGTFALADVLRGGGTDAWSADAVRVLLDLVFAETCCALIAVAVGLIVRSTIASLGVVLGFFYLVPLILGLIPVDAVNLVGRSVPGASLGALTALTPAAGDLDPAVLTVTTAVWTGAWLIAAVVTVKRRNV